VVLCVYMHACLCVFCFVYVSVCVGEFVQTDYVGGEKERMGCFSLFVASFLCLV
jgi:hypothetical protein